MLLNSLILKLASPCNLNCQYCYVYNHKDKTYLTKPKLMSKDIFLTSINKSVSYYDKHSLTSLNVFFHGGEPTLYNVEVLDELMIKAKQIIGERRIFFGMQTNATLINKKWIELFLKHDIQIGVSLDGDKDIHDSVRVFHSNKGSYDYVVKGLNLLNEYKLDPDILCVINPAYSGLAVYKHFRFLGLTEMDFLIPDATHDSRELWYGSYGETPVADYLIPIFDDWFAEDNPKIKIRIFKDIIKKILGGSGETDLFGNPLMNYLIVETDGGIETLDALRVCKEGINKTGLNILSAELEDTDNGNGLTYSLLTKGLPLSSTCLACEIKDFCGGGYVAHRYSDKNQFDNPSVWCKDIKKLVTHISNALFND